MLKHASNVEIMLKHVNIVLINASNMFKHANMLIHVSMC